MSSPLPSMFERDVRQFVHYVRLERGLASTTSEAYRHDVSQYALHLVDLQRSSFADATLADVRSFFDRLATMGLAASSRSRYLASIRHLNTFLVGSGRMQRDVTEAMEMPYSHGLIVSLSSLGFVVTSVSRSYAYVYPHSS